MIELSLSEPQLGPRKDEQYRHDPQCADPGIQHHPAPPPFAFAHPLQQTHSLARRLHAGRVLVQSVRGAVEQLGVGFERGGEGGRGGFEGLGEGEQGGGQVGGFHVVVGEEVRLRCLSIGGGWCALGGGSGRLFSDPDYGGGCVGPWRGWLFGFGLLRCWRRGGADVLAQYILLIFRSVEQVIIVAVGFEVVQSVREPFY